MSLVYDYRTLFLHMREQLELVLSLLAPLDREEEDDARLEAGAGETGTGGGARGVSDFLGLTVGLGCVFCSRREASSRWRLDCE